MSGRIVLAWTQRPEDYEKKRTVISQAAASYHVYTALRKHFGQRVHFVKRDDAKAYRLSGDDLLVAYMPNPWLPRWNRSIFVSNDNFETNKWKHGKWTKYGLEFKTDHTWRVNSNMINKLGGFLMSNDVAIQKMKDGHHDVIEKKRWYEKHVPNLHIMQHPIDKEYWCKMYDPERQYDRPRMFIYNAGWRKNAAQLILLLKRLGFRQGKEFEVVSGVNKRDNALLRKIVNRNTYVGHTSISECFPYFANEFMCQGVMLYGHEEWWTGYGYDCLRWTYDPKRQDKNAENLKRIMSKDFLPEYLKMRKDIWNRHINRKDNDWSYFTDAMIQEIERHL